MRTSVQNVINIPPIKILNAWRLVEKKAHFNRWCCCGLVLSFAIFNLCISEMFARLNALNSFKKLQPRLVMSIYAFMRDDYMLMATVDIILTV